MLFLIAAIFLSFGNVSTIVSEKTGDKGYSLAEETVLESDIEYVNGVYFYEKRVFSGNIVAYYHNQKLKYKCEVLDGRLHGITTEFFSNGEIKSRRNYFLNKLYGKFTEYFPSGQVKIEGQVGHQNYKGGETLENVTIGSLKKGRYKSKSIGHAEIVFIDPKGKEYPSSENVPIYKQNHYQVKTVGKQEVLVEVY